MKEFDPGVFWKWTAIGLVVLSLIHTAYHWRDFHREQAIAQRDQLAASLASIPFKDPKAVVSVNEILKTNGRPDLQREVPQKQVAQKGTDERAEAESGK